MSKNVLIISAAMLKERTPIHTNIDEKLIFPIIKVCEDMYIHPLLGSALYNKIITQVEAGNVTGDYLTLQRDYILDCVMWYVLSEMVGDITWQIWNKGVVRKSGDNVDLPDAETMEGRRNSYRTRAEWYGQRLKTYLMAVSTSDVLPEYITGNNDIDDIVPTERAFTMPIYLGPDYTWVDPVKGKCCNHEG